MWERLAVAAFGCSLALQGLLRSIAYSPLGGAYDAKNAPSKRLFAAGLRAGGKDSTVLAHMMTVLNERHGYGLDLFLLSIDEGISGYRDDSLETVKRNEAQCAPLKGPAPAAAYVLLMHRLPDPQTVRLGRQYSQAPYDRTGSGYWDIQPSRAWAASTHLTSVLHALFTHKGRVSRNKLLSLCAGTAYR